jgi:hypothetical protein
MLGTAADEQKSAAITGVMIEVKSTGDFSAVEVQVCQGLEFSDVGNHCKRRDLNQNHHGV